MKTAIYIEDSVLQLVLTPETKWEQSALDQLKDKALTAKFHNGQFYDCAGGWVRQRRLVAGCEHDTASEASLMIRADVVPESRESP